MIRPARQWIVAAAFVLVAAGSATAQQPPPDDATRYMAMGDSIAAGYKAQPATRGYAFLLYESGVFDRVSATVFNNIATVGATSQDVLGHQVPLALIEAARGGFVPQHVTLTAGGNDLAAVHRFAATGPAPAVLQAYISAALLAYQNNLAAILQALTQNAPGRKIYVANQYSVPEIGRCCRRACRCSRPSTRRRPLWSPPSPAEPFSSTSTRPSTDARACC
jgi:lysophospholipase L1-like esterase